MGPLEVNEICDMVGDMVVFEGSLEVGEGKGGWSGPSGGRRGPERPEWSLWRSERVREAGVGPLEVDESPLEVGEGQGGRSGLSGDR